VWQARRCGPKFGKKKEGGLCCWRAVATAKVHLVPSFEAHGKKRKKKKRGGGGDNIRELALDRFWGQARKRFDGRNVKVLTARSGRWLHRELLFLVLGKRGGGGGPLFPALSDTVFTIGMARFEGRVEKRGGKKRGGQKKGGARAQ